LEIAVALSHSQVKGISVVTLDGGLDIKQVLEIGKELRDFATGHGDYCVVDVQQVSSFDSAGVGLIVECHRVLRDNGGGIALVGDSSVQDHFRRMGFGNEMSCFSTVNQAVDSYTAETLDCDLESLPQDLFDTED
jgi:anti-anti-sigma factor